MIDLIVWVALMMSIGTGIYTMYVFDALVDSKGSITIPVDKYNEAELIIAITILALVIVALVCFTVRILRR